MVSLRTALLGGLVAVAAAKSAVLDLIPKNFDKVVHQSGKPTLVEFFAPWCGHCKTLAPVYEELALAFSHAADKVQIAKVDADSERSLGKKYGVQGFPTLKWFDGSSAEPSEYSGGRDFDSLAGFITEKTGVKPKKKWAPAPKVVMLHDHSFNDAIGGDKNVFVAFTAPWCGHCKSLAPTWENIAETFDAESDVVIAKIDCDSENSKAACASESVTGFPTLKWFPKGSRESEAYNGGRNDEALAKFINKKAGTHRLPGGALNDVAGTIESLDAVASGYASAGIVKLGEFAAKAKAEADKIADEAQAKFAAYYVRVFDKLAANEEYVAKETARLGGLLEKAGLAQSKRDEIQAKLNILRKFVAQEAEEKADADAKDEL